MSLALFAVLPLLQGVWTVDASGAGQFLELNAAIAVAAPGDILLVAPGTYAPLVTSKRVTILGPADGAPAHVLGSSAVTNTDGMTIAGMTFDALQFVDVSGTIRLEDVRIVDPQPNQALVSLCFVRCSHARATRVVVDPLQCAPAGFPYHGIRVIDSTLHLSSSFVRGGAGCSEDPGAGAPGGDALFAEGASTVVVCTTILRAGAGGPCAPEPCTSGANGRAIRTDGHARVYVRGRGEGIWAVGFSEQAIETGPPSAEPSVVVADSVPIIGLTSSGVLIVPRTEPYLGLDASLAGSARDRDLRIDGPADAVGLVFASPAAPPLPLPGFTLPAFIDVSAILWSAALVTNDIAPTWIPFASPPVSGALTGLVVTFQAVFPDVPATPGTSGLFVTNAVDWIFRP